MKIYLNACLIVVSYSISTSNHNLNGLRSWISPVVSYSISTSNHNQKCFYCKSWRLYLIPFLHQTTTCKNFLLIASSCILFHFYIKPQQRIITSLFLGVVSYSISTSNHNIKRGGNVFFWLYLIPFLHQTTTGLSIYVSATKLYLIPFLHQTTTFIF